MITDIWIKEDPLKERYLYGCELSPRGYPIVPECHADVEDLRPVDFTRMAREPKTRQCFGHFFIDDHYFENIWKDFDRYIPMMRNFQVTVSPDFSPYSNLPPVLWKYNVFRNHALAWWMWVNDIRMIPSVVWGDYRTFDDCFEGYTTGTAVTTTTNGCQHEKKLFYDGFKEMCDRIKPSEIVIVGRKLPIPDVDAKVTWKQSVGEQLADKKLKEGMVYF